MTLNRYSDAEIYTELERRAKERGKTQLQAAIDDNQCFINGERLPLREHSQHLAEALDLDDEQVSILCGELRNVLSPLDYFVRTHLEASGLSARAVALVLFGLTRCFALLDAIDQRSRDSTRGAE